MKKLGVFCVPIPAHNDYPRLLDLVAGYCHRHRVMFPGVWVGSGIIRADASVSDAIRAVGGLPDWLDDSGGGEFECLNLEPRMVASSIARGALERPEAFTSVVSQIRNVGRLDGYDARDLGVFQRGWDSKIGAVFAIIANANPDGPIVIVASRAAFKATFQTVAVGAEPFFTLVEFDRMTGRLDLLEAAEIVATSVPTDSASSAPADAASDPLAAAPVIVAAAALATRSLPPNDRTLLAVSTLTPEGARTPAPQPPERNLKPEYVRNVRPGTRRQSPDPRIPLGQRPNGPAR